MTVFRTAAALALVLAGAAPAWADGSRELTNSGGVRPHLEASDRLNTPSGIPRDNRIYVWAQPGETILVASSALGIGEGGIELMRPDGTVVTVQSQPACWDNTRTGTARALRGRIASVTQEVAGPLGSTNSQAGGYAACELAVGAGQGGIWRVHFTAPQRAQSTPPPVAARAAWTQAATVSATAAWDVTVRATSGANVPGRVWARYLPINTGAYAYSSGGQTVPAGISSALYVVTRDGYRWTVDHNGMVPFAAILLADRRGFTSVSTGLKAYTSVTTADLSGAQPAFRVNSPITFDDATETTHKLFLAPLAADLPASAPVFFDGQTRTDWIFNRTPRQGGQVTGFRFVGADGVEGQVDPAKGGRFEFTTDGEGAYTVRIDRDGNPATGPDGFETVLLAGQAREGANTVPWNGRDAGGAPVAAGLYRFRVGFAPRRGEIHFPYFDVEQNPDGIIVTRTNGPGAPAHLVYWDDTRLGGTASAAGASSQTGAHRWGNTTSGDPALDFGNETGIDTWSYIDFAEAFSETTIRSAAVDLGVEVVPRVATVDRGGAAVYSVTVTNHGPDAAPLARLTAAFPAALRGVTWTCAVTTNASGPVQNRCSVANGTTTASGTGDIAQDVALNPGTVLTFTVRATHDGASENPVTTEASVAVRDAQDAVPSNNTASATVAVRPPLQPAPGLCYAVADQGGAGGGDDWLIALTRSFGQASPIGVGTGTGSIEAIAYYPDSPSGTLYAADGRTLGTLDLDTGVFSAIGAFGTAGGAAGEIALTDADGLAFDPLTGRLYASHRRGGNPDLEDILFVADLATGAHVPNAFGPGVDYVVIASASIGKSDIDDLAIDPRDGQLYGVANQSGGGDDLIRIDKRTGAVTLVGPLGQPDVEGLAFAAGGVFYGTTGDAGGARSNSFFTVDVASGAASFLGTFPVGRDYEAVACLTDGLNTLTGIAFDDATGDGAYQPGPDAPRAGETVTLYRDLDGSGTVTPGDPAVATATTAADGTFSFRVAAEGAFALAAGGLAGGGVYTTPSSRGASFASYGNAASGLDLGVTTEADLRLAVAVDQPAPQTGDVVAFTLSLVNDGPAGSSGSAVEVALSGDLELVDVQGAAYDPATGTYAVGALAAGAVSAVTVTARTTGPAPGTLSAQVASQNEPDGDSEPGNNDPAEDDQGAATVTPARPDLELSATTSNAAPGLGAETTLTVSLANVGSGRATGVVVAAAVPPDYALVGASASQGSYTDGVWTLADPVGAGASATLALVVRAETPDPVVFAAEVAAQTEPDIDSQPGNAAQVSEDDDAAVGLDARAPDLALAVSASTPTPIAGRPVTITVDLSNEGTAEATGVSVQVPIPAGYTVVSSAPGQGSYTPETGLWSVGDVAVGAAPRLEIVLRTPAEAATVTAEVAAASPADVDSQPGNGDPGEDDQDAVTITPQTADLALAMTVDEPQPAAGDVVAFAVTVTNEGAFAATGVQISNRLVEQPGVAEIVSVTPSAGTFDGSLWTVGALAPGASETLTIAVRLLSDRVAFTNLAEVAAADQPDTDSVPYNGSTFEDDDASATATTGGSSSGGEGGLESDGSLAEAIGQVLFARRAETGALADAGVALEPVAFQTSRSLGASIRRFLPAQGPRGAAAVEVSPTDLLPVTNAREIVAADYLRGDGRRAGVVFASATAPGEVYEHTKPVCDRLRGATLDAVDLVDVEGRPFVMTRLVQPDGAVDYAVSFVAYGPEDARTVDSRFLLGDYRVPAGGADVLNVQVWSPSPEHTRALVAEVLARLGSESTLTFRNAWAAAPAARTPSDGAAGDDDRQPQAASRPELPVVFVRAAEYDQGRVRLDVYNAGGARTLRLSGGTLARAEGGGRSTFARTVELQPGTPEAPVVHATVETGFLFDVAFFVETDLSPAPDRLYLADGTWGVAVDPSSAATRLDNFAVRPQPDAAPASGQRLVERPVHATGTVATWATVYRTLRAGAQPLDLNGYRYVEFTAAGAGEAHLLVQKQSIVSADQYGATVALTPEPRVHRIWFEDLTLADGSRGFTGEDAVALSLTRRSDGTPQPLDVAVSGLRFGGGAGDLAALPAEPSLWPAMPNPFAGSTRLRFELPEAQPVRVRVFDVLGREVARLADGEHAAGRHTLTFGGRGLGAGVYIVRLELADRAFTRQMTLVR